MSKRMRRANKRVSSILGTLAFIAGCGALSGCGTAQNDNAATVTAQNIGSTPQPSAPATTTRTAPVVENDKEVPNQTNSISTGLPFTVDAYLSKVPNLKPAESLGEFKTSQKFSCDFADSTGTITGEYSKSDRKLQHLMVTGSGPIYMTAVKVAILLSTKNRSTASCKELLEKLSSADLADYSTSSDGLTFSFSKMMNQPVFALTNANDAVKSDEQLRQDYITPTVGVTLDAFKRGFNTRMTKINPTLKIKGSGEETTSPSYFEYSFTVDTILHVYANDKMQIESIELDSAPKDGSKFWSCADATLAGLQPGMRETNRSAMLNRICASGRNSFPTTNTDFDDGKFQYNCQLLSMSDGCALTIQSNLP